MTIIQIYCSAEWVYIIKVQNTTNECSSDHSHDDPLFPQGSLFCKHPPPHLKSLLFHTPSSSAQPLLLTCTLSIRMLIIKHNLISVETFCHLHFKMMENYLQMYNFSLCNNHIQEISENVHSNPLKHKRLSTMT